MLYNPKTEFSFWRRNYVTQMKILKANVATMKFIGETYKPIFYVSNELITYWDLNKMKLDRDISYMILSTVRELQNEVDFYQNILKESCVYDSNF